MVEYRMSKMVLKRMTNKRQKPLLCQHCQKPIVEGDLTVSTSGGGFQSKRFHKKCFEEMWQ